MLLYKTILKKKKNIYKGLLITIFMVFRNTQQDANKLSKRCIRQKKITTADKTVKQINVSFLGKFFGFVFDRKVFLSNISKNGKSTTAYMRLPPTMAGKTYTVILIPRELNTKIFQKGERVDWNQFYDGTVKDEYFEKFRGGLYSDFDKQPTKLDITDDEVRL